MKTTLKNFLNDESGVTAIEYGLIAALVSIVIVGTFGAFADDLGTLFENLGDELNDPATELNK